MTPQEAIEIITNAIQTENMTAEQDKALAIVQKATDKQIAKKPIEDTANLTDFKTFHCPICNKKIVSRLDGEWIAGRPQKYCEDCGQALDWSN